ncbi:hypothetical protein SLS56_011846 [Neofusicoccum ribis]|uniref:Uncharacterized protein n=1 Tax=Neofusicoccum ribis TaxID=45134 RepID=A0ABR3SBH8_9PEZI
MGQVLTKVKEMAANAVNWIKQHPYKMAMCVANTAIVLAPAIVTAPLLRFLGFTALGPAAGTAVAIGAAALTNGGSDGDGENGDDESGDEENCDDGEVQ